jgi:hypothetical protein
MFITRQKVSSRRLKSDLRQLLRSLAAYTF